MAVLIIGIILLVIGSILTFKGIKINAQTLEENLKIKATNENLLAEQETLRAEHQFLKEKCLELNSITNTFFERLENTKDELRNSYYKYCDQLELAYSMKEENFDGQVSYLEKKIEQKKIEINEEYNIFLKNLENSYDLTQQDIIKKIEENKQELEKWKNTRAAALEAHRREQEIELQSDFYRLHLTESEKVTINLINELKPRLPEPRVLSMLVWQTFYQKKMKDLCTKVLGTKTKCGIYKITNLKTGMCYIGQTVNADTRWKDHAKCGLGIDTPVGNKLYQAMLKDGLDSFTFEFLEEVPAATLNEKEKFYIDLYDSCNFGYNSTKGNK